MVNDFVKWLENELDKKNWTRAYLAKRAGISQSILSMIYSKTRHPGSETLNAIARAFKLPPEIVYRAAGLLPPAPKIDAKKEMILHLAEQLPDEEYDDLVAYIEMRINRVAARPKEKGRLSDEAKNKSTA